MIVRGADADIVLDQPALMIQVYPARHALQKDLCHSPLPLEKTMAAAIACTPAVEQNTRSLAAASQFHMGRRNL
jgi:hypothetical protein